jgi:predicted glycogen debranching enzyme
MKLSEMGQSEKGSVPRAAEWLETDGLGGFASGTVGGIRTRRYHALLLTASTPPTGRFVLVNGLDAWLETPGGTYPLSSHLYPPDVVYPDGAKRIDDFTTDPWPRWTFLLDDGSRLEHDILVARGSPAVILGWRLPKKKADIRLHVRLFFSGRDYHELQRENPAFRFDADSSDGRVGWQPYDGVPGVAAFSNGVYEHRPEWYRDFLYEEERARGLDYLEDLATPGVFHFDLSSGEALLVLAVAGSEPPALGKGTLATAVKNIRAAERLRRGRFADGLERSADAYIVKRGEGSSVVAGYPWFTDWGRDTFIALRGLCLACGKLDLARTILLTWAGTVSEGMLPNRFPDHGHEAEYNAVDASLWFIIAVHDYFRSLEAHKKKATRKDQKLLWDAVDAILDGYTQGTRFGIHADSDGLLAAGQADVALTWMDAKVDGSVVAPRTGKPVEVQALWLNALWLRDRQEMYERGLESFRTRFWNEHGGFLYDVVDCQHQAGTVDTSFRPNQIFAVGGLPQVLLDKEQARKVVDMVEARLLTPLGLRSLAPGEGGYAPHYEGGARQRDHAYHQGTVWPWLTGPFVEAWLQVRGNTAKARKEARKRFLEPLLAHLGEAGLGHVSEIADAEPPHTPRGCPFMAWSLGELIRLNKVVLR